MNTNKSFHFKRAWYVKRTYKCGNIKYTKRVLHVDFLHTNILCCYKYCSLSFLNSDCDCILKANYGIKVTLRFKPYNEEKKMHFFKWLQLLIFSFSKTKHNLYLLDFKEFSSLFICSFPALNERSPLLIYTKLIGVYGCVKVLW